MPEILTESFCERCGTRYTFESAAPKTARLKGVKVFSRGLKNFVLSDDTSMDEAMAAARSETDREITSFQLDAFHKTFNFCMTCRQYTCGNCWNEAEGSCLSCTPHLGQDILPAPFPDLDRHGGFPAVNGANGLNGTNGANGHAPVDEPGMMAWPTSDLMQEAEAVDQAVPPTPDQLLDDGAGIEPVDMATRLASLGGFAAASEPTTDDAPTEAVVETEVVADAAVVAEAEIVPEAIDTASDPVVAETMPTEVPHADVPDLAELADATAQASQAPVAEPVVEPDAGMPAPQPDVAAEPDDVGQRAAARTSALFQKFRPGQSLDDEIAAFEAEQATSDAVEIAPIGVVAEAVAEEPVVAEPVVEAVAEEPVVAEPVVEAVAEEPVVAEPVVEAVAEEPVVAEPVVEAPDAPPIEAVAAAAVVLDVVTPAAAEIAPAEPAVEEPAAPQIAAEVAPVASETPATVDAAPLTAEAPTAEAPTTEDPAPRVDVVEQPTWRIVAPETPVDAPAPVVPMPPAPPVVPTTPTEPQWPAQPEWPSQRPAAGLGGLQAAAGGSLESLWEESAREVAAVPLAASARPAATVAPCVNCGLSLSASARFCRRCGTRQS